MGNDLVVHGVSDLAQMAETFAKSGLFGIKTIEQGIALMLIAQAEGLHPAVAARDYDIIQGRPALKARAMLSRFQSSGGKLEWIERSDTAAEAQFSHPCSPKPISVRWDMERAKLAGLGGKENWRKFPRQMLSARVISEGVAACYPMATSGLYVPEEVEDFDAGFQKAKPANTPKPKEPEKKPAAPPVEDAHVIETSQTPQNEAQKPPEAKSSTEQPKTPPSPPNAKSEQSAGDVAAEIAKIRKLAHDCGIRTGDEFAGVISGFIGRPADKTTDLNAAERIKAIEGLEAMKGVVSNG